MAADPVPTRGADWRPPWQSLPPDLPGRLAPAIPGIMARIIETVPEQIPAYASAREGRYGKNLTRGVTTALEQLMSLPGTARPALSPESRALMAYLGAGEFREGRTMDALLGAYRTAARIVFRDLSAECARLGLDMAVVIDLGESIWAYIDELSAVSAQAYAEAQSETAGVLERRRADLAAALVGGSSAADVPRLAEAADWPLPERVCVLVVPADGAGPVRASLGRRGLVLEREGEVLAVVEAPRGTRAQRLLLDALDGTGAVVGPSSPWRDAPSSARAARILVRRRPLLPDGVGRAPLLAEDHLGAVVLGAEPDVVDRLASRALAPLDGLTPAKRAVLEETLAAWLAHWGQRSRVAVRLNVHPQTVGYRVGRLRELFGDALDDPDARFDLELALRARGVGRGVAAAGAALPG